jgi:hypothetical protein
VTDAWKNPSYAAGPMKRIVVMGLDVDATTRHLVEDRFAADLRTKGVQAAQSYAVLGEVLPDRETARREFARGAYDGALVLRLERVTERSHYVPNDRFFGSPYNNYWGPSGSYAPGYVVTDELVQFEASLWDLRDGMRVWTANTNTTNPSSSRDFAKSLSKKVLPQLVEEGLVAKSS